MGKKGKDDDWSGIVVEGTKGPEISKDMKESTEETVFRLLEKNDKDITIIAHNE